MVKILFAWGVLKKRESVCFKNGNNIYIIYKKFSRAGLISAVHSAENTWE